MCFHVSLCAAPSETKVSEIHPITFFGLSKVPLPVPHGNWKDLLKVMWSWSMEMVTTPTSRNHYLEKENSFTVSKRSFNCNLNLNSTIILYIHLIISHAMLDDDFPVRERKLRVQGKDLNKVCF